MAEDYSDSGPASGAGLIGGILSGVQGLYQPFISQNWASNAGNQGFDLQRWWAVNQYSLATKGLRKAGINPMLAYTKGIGGGQSTDVPYATYDSDGDVIGRAVGSAREAASLRSQLNILRDEEAIAGYRREQERENVFKVGAESAEAAARAKIAEANRDIVNATKDASISSARQGAEQASTTTDSMRVQLEILRSQMPSAKALEEFDASPAGQRLIQLRRSVELSPKVKAGALGEFGVK